MSDAPVAPPSEGLADQLATADVVMLCELVQPLDLSRFNQDGDSNLDHAWLLVWMGTWYRYGPRVGRMMRRHQL